MAWMLWGWRYQSGNAWKMGYLYVPHKQFEQKTLQKTHIQNLLKKWIVMNEKRRTSVVPLVLLHIPSTNQLV